MRVALAILVALGACCAPGGEIAPPDAGPGPDGGRKGMYSAGKLTRVARGHEDLVRFAIDVANTLLSAETGQETYFTPVLYGAMCGDSENPMLQGNCATDEPADAMASRYGASAGSWHVNPNLQSLHFLRDYDGSGLYSGKESCLRARSRIVQATALAMQL
jgi:hypothetical protein